MAGPGEAWPWHADKASNTRPGARPWRLLTPRRLIALNLGHQAWSAATWAANLCTCCSLSVVQDPQQWSNGLQSGQRFAQSYRPPARSVITTGVATTRECFLQIAFTHCEITSL